MSATLTDHSSNETRKDDLEKEIQALRKDLEVQTATQAGAHATQAAAHAGTWSTVLAGSGGLIVGMFLALALVGPRRK
jgi:hypothetical protein